MLAYIIFHISYDLNLLTAGDVNSIALSQKVILKVYQFLIYYNEQSQRYLNEKVFFSSISIAPKSETTLQYQIMWD